MPSEIGYALRAVTVAGAAVLATLAGCGRTPNAGVAAVPSATAFAASASSPARAASPTVSPLLGDGTSNHPSTGSPSGPTSRVATPPAASTHLTNRVCDGTHLVATVSSEGSVANQPFTIVAVRNTGSACYVDGYPMLTGARGGILLSSGGHTRASAVNITVRHGADYERPDPGPSHVDLATGESASFVIGTVTALDPPIYIITSLTVVPPGGTTGVRLVAGIPATARHHEAIPMLVTAFVAGTAGPPVR